LTLSTLECEQQLTVNRGAHGSREVHAPRQFPDSGSLHLT